MPRLLGVDIPKNKKIEYALRYVYGIGPTRAVIVLKEAKIDPNVRAQDLSEEQLNRISEVINQKGYKVEGDLRRERTASLKRLQSIQCYRGIRHGMKLPARGQRTRTNARTTKGSKQTVGVVRKSVKK